MTAAPALDRPADAAAVRGRRRPRKSVGIAVVAGLVVAAAVISGAIVSRGSVSGGSHRHMKLARVAGGLPLVTSGKPLQSEIAQSLTAAFVAGRLSGIEVGIYSASADRTDGIVVGGADAGGFTDALRQVQQYTGAQDGLAAQNGFSPGTVATARSYPAGVRGGQAACDTMYLATTGIPVSVCAWVDSGTNGYAISNDLPPAQLAGKLAAMRVDMEQ